MKKQSEADKARFCKACPKKLTSLPENICPLGLERAQWTRDNVGHLNWQEKSAPGCSYGILTDDEDSYCFFKMMHNKSNQVFSDEEIAYRLGITKQQVMKASEKAFQKLSQTELIKELAILHKEGGLFSSINEEEDNSIYFPDDMTDEAPPPEEPTKP